MCPGICRPLEADLVTVGIGQIQLLHAVRRDFWFFGGDALCAEVGVRGIYVRAAEVEDDVLVDGDTRGVGVGGRRPRS